MPKFREQEVQLASGQKLNHRAVLIAQRYCIQEKLGRGSFGTVFLVRDTEVAEGEYLKVLKEVPVGDLNPDETMQVQTEAQLLAQLHHPSILKFYSSFLEKDIFCIITEYCEDGDLDCKLEELRQTGARLPESQVAEWLVQLLLGVHYMHQRKILHRDLKAKNIFLKKNIVKIGDFGVSRLLNGSCDLATTFTGTPFYMSPEVLSHQGYNSKSDIWSLGCLLYEMCSLERAFKGHSFLSVVMKILEGPVPPLPQSYSKELGAILEGMLSKDPAVRPSAADLLKMSFIEENMQSIRLKIYSKAQKCERHAGVMQKTVPLGHSDVQKMTPRERMRLKKLQAADEEANRFKHLAEEKYEENCRRMQELRCLHFQKVSVDVLNESTEATGSHITGSLGQLDVMGDQDPGALRLSQLEGDEIPVDPQKAEAHYNEDGFESCSEEDDEADEELTIGQQDSDLEAMVSYMKNILGDPSTEVPERGCPSPRAPTTQDCTMAETRMQRIRESIQRKLGAAEFQTVYKYLKQARQQQESEARVWENLGHLVDQPSNCFEVDQLLYYEKVLQNIREGHA
ncbi:serine/threonine-protein kinase Nek11-like isoform X1 [Brienomyrus brachyistius]|uniref:serine/threonine-protein kinase Nek11-like isoform X1 n=1 Tax=Brienomyrus brachyistius TaxID=42636 RepID=UPI0020B39C7B|nr:serine/threonine-protein kinase Nek11-like isoform X1 [Brienomyrus brachyistius]